MKAALNKTARWSLFLLASVLSLDASAAPAPLSDAIAAWHMATTNDASGLNSVLTVHGNVRLGVPLRGEDRTGSLARQGDGQIAQFQGGWLSAGQGAKDELNLSGKQLSIALRLRDPSGRWSYPIFSKYGGHSRLAYNVFATSLEGKRALGAEIGSTKNDRILQTSFPVESFDSKAWHDLVIRCDGAKVELFVDGRCVDEDFMLGTLRRGNPMPVLIGAQAVDAGKIEGGFEGMIDHVFLWNRALSSEEILMLAGQPDSTRERERTDAGLKRETMQYWRPPNQYFVGDCMPFFHDGVFHFVYLLDRRHHAAKNGLGAHQWAQATSRDLVHWQHEPLMLPIDDQWEGSICTGSTLFHEETFYAAYATRASGLRFPAGYQYFNVATSRDGLRFQKAQPNPLNAPPHGYAPEDWRDPFVRFDPQDGLFHVIITARDLKQGGCLAHLVSKDMKEFDYLKPLLYSRDFPGTGDVPECPDWFAWGKYQYLIYNGCYLVSTNAHGPWRLPENFVLDGRVMKTAPFTGNRRIGTAWISHIGFGNRAIFREAVQRPDGSLGWKFVPEMNPPVGDRLPVSQQLSGRGTVQSTGLPGNYRLALQFKTGEDQSPFGLRFRCTEKSPGVELRFDPAAGTIQLGSARKKLGKPFQGTHRIEAYLRDEIIDVCVDDMETLVICEHPQPGDSLVLWSDNPSTEMADLELRPLVSERVSH